MSLHLQVHQMAIAAERQLLSAQAERGWLVEAATGTTKRRSFVSAARVRTPLAAVLGRARHARQAAPITMIPAAAPTA